MGSGRFRRNVLIALVRVFVSTSVGSSKLSLSLFFLSRPSVNRRLTLEVTPTTRYNPWSSRPRLSSVLKHLEKMESLWIHYKSRYKKKFLYSRRPVLRATLWLDQSLVRLFFSTFLQKLKCQKNSKFALRAKTQANFCPKTQTGGSFSQY